MAKLCDSPCRTAAPDSVPAGYVAPALPREDRAFWSGGVATAAQRSRQGGTAAWSFYIVA